MDIKELTTKIETLESQIENQEKRKNQLEGKLEQIKETLKTDFNISPDEIDKILNEKVTELSILEKEIETQLNSLEGL
jgi:hypothetical protein